MKCQSIQSKCEHVSGKKEHPDVSITMVPDRRSSVYFPCKETTTSHPMRFYNLLYTRRAAAVQWANLCETQCRSTQWWWTTLSPVSSARVLISAFMLTGAYPVPTRKETGHGFGGTVLGTKQLASSESMPFSIPENKDTMHVLWKNAKTQFSGENSGYYVQGPWLFLWYGQPRTLIYI